MQESFLSPILLCQLLGMLALLLPFVTHPNRGNRYKKSPYYQSSYYQITKNSYSSIHLNSGQYGEYLIYKNLQHFEKNGSRFLFNVYVPKSNNETTEIDVLLICSKGLLVFESKNFSGWIFGNAAHKNWTQTLPYGWQGDCIKTRFYNPIMQNASHIKYLRRLFDRPLPIYSIVVFSDQCTLKQITLSGDSVRVINSNNLSSVVDQIWSRAQNDVLTESEVNAIYNKLYPYTQVNSEVKLRHYDNLREIRHGY